MKKYIIPLLLLYVSVCFGQNRSSNMIEKKYISNYEYRQFTNWVRDSIAYSICIEENLTDIYQPKGTLRIDWNQKLDWNTIRGKNYLSNLFLPEYERFYRTKNIDTRKLNYNYKNKVISVYPDTLIWIDTLAPKVKTIYGTWEYEEDGFRNNLSTYYYSHPYFDDYPVQGVTAEQIDAFLYWSNSQPQGHRNYNKQKSIDTVQADIDTEFWEITNAEYREFIEWTIDSIARRLLGDYMEGYLITVDNYGNEIDPPLINWKKKLNWNSIETKDALTKILTTENTQKYKGLHGINKWFITYEYYRMDLNYAAQPKMRYQGLIDRSIFIYKDIVYVYPDTLVSPDGSTRKTEDDLFLDRKYENNLIKGISYLMARSYYIWYGRTKGNSIITDKTNPIGNLVIPSKKQWQAMISGNNQKILIRKMKIPEIHYYH